MHSSRWIISAPEAKVGRDVKPDELAELPRVVGGEDVGEMKFNLLPVGIGDGVLVFHRCLQTLSLLFLQEAIEDGVGSLELRVRENVYGHGRRKHFDGSNGKNLSSPVQQSKLSAFAPLLTPQTLVYFFLS